MIENMLAKLAGHRTQMKVPQRGSKKRLLDLAAQNAAMIWKSNDPARTQGKSQDKCIGRTAGNPTYGNIAVPYLKRMISPTSPAPTMSA